MRANAPELAFLPAALEIERTPPLPASRLVLWAICTLLVTALVWASLSRVDVVGVAAGHIVPSGRVKQVQAAVAGTVREIAVAEGDRVAAGDVLIVLDDTVAAAELAQARIDHAHAAAERRRLRGLLERLNGQSPAAPAHAAASVRSAREFAAFAAERERLRAVLEQAQAERSALDAQIARADAVLPLLTERAASLARLATSGHAARASWLERERERLERHHDRAMLLARRPVLDAAVVSAARRVDAHAGGAEARWLNELAAAGARAEAALHAIDKARRRRGQLTLLAPVEGTVQELALHTVGGVVTPAQVLMVIVPHGARPVVEARVLNRDIGFVQAGQDAVVKVETYPFTRYGTLPGRVAQVSRDAVADERLGAVYLARVELARRTLTVDGRRADVVPGMAVRVEIHLGERRVIEYLLAPLLRFRDEGLTER